jgi:ATP-binding cassette subfamily F protein 3
MDDNLTVLETVDRAAVGDIRTKIRDILGAFLFGGEDVDKKVKVLSGGERSRLAMARMLLQPFNLLILDEPTNHLDMRSKDILKSALLAFDGTLIVVSHDREFLDGLVDKVFEFRDNKVNEHLGGIYDFLQRRKLASLREVERKEQPASPGRADVQSGGEADRTVAGTSADPSSGSLGKEGVEPQSNKAQYAEKKAQEKKIRKIANRVKSLEHEIEQIEEELSKMDEMLMNPENIKGMEVYEEYEQLKKKHDEALASWEKQTLLLEKVAGKRK